MSTLQKSHTKIIIAAVIIIATMGYLAFTGVRDNKSYYVTISEFRHGQQGLCAPSARRGQRRSRQHPSHRHLCRFRRFWNKIAG